MSTNVDGRSRDGFISASHLDQICNAEGEDDGEYYLSFHLPPPSGCAILESIDQLSKKSFLFMW